MRTIYRIYSFGYSKHGQLGHGPETEITTPNPPQEIQSLTPLDPVSVACGGAFSAVVTKNGQVYSFGDLRESTPQLEMYLRKMQVVKVWCSAMFSVAMVEGGGVYLWGTMNKNVTQEFWIPQKLTFPSSTMLAGIACGALHSLFYAKDGTLYVYGNNTQGQLGMDPTQTPELQIPQHFQFFRQKQLKILQAACGGSHSIVLTKDSQVWTFGANQYGQLGTGDFQNRLEPVNITGKFPNQVQSIACGDYHTLVVDCKGLLYTFGKNTCGQLGTGKFENSAIPLLVDELLGEKVVKVAAGGGFSCAHSLALTADGKLYAWGNGKSGQLGFPVNESGMQPRPSQVSFFKGHKVEDIACGWLHTLVLTSATTTARPVVPRTPVYEPSFGNFHFLPNDILSKILHYLNTVDASRLGICSKPFFALTNDTEFWALAATKNLKPSMTNREWDLLLQRAQNETWKLIYTQEFVKKHKEMHFNTEDLKKISKPVPLGFFGTIQNFLSSRSIYNLFQMEREINILMLGLDAAGKTTILYKLRLGQVEESVPTIGFNLETIHFRKTKFTVWDVGGPDKIYKLWQQYYKNTEALVFVIDSSDRCRMDTARDELEKILVHLPNMVPILIFANKQDLPQALPLEEIKEMFVGLMERQRQPWYIQLSSAVLGDGLYEGFLWLSNVLEKAKVGVDISSLHGFY